MSLICFATTFSYLVYVMNEMMQGENDNYNIQSRPNPLLDGQNMVFLSNSTLFPWIRLETFNLSLMKDK